MENLKKRKAHIKCILNEFAKSYLHGDSYTMQIELPTIKDRKCFPVMYYKQSRNEDYCENPSLLLEGHYDLFESFVDLILNGPEEEVGEAFCLDREIFNKHKKRDFDIDISKLNNKYLFIKPKGL